MNQGLSDKVRAMAQTKYVHPAIRSGKRQFSISVRDLLGDLSAEGFPARHTPQICSALQTAKFLRENGLEIEEILGPPSKQSPTVVLKYRVAKAGAQTSVKEDTLKNEQTGAQEEDPAAWAFRVTEKARGLLKEELAEYGGGEAFLRWIRSEDGDAA
ncbi:MAG TPA: hypothetical protein VGE83_04400 [Terracidiphilus sp.]|jgi:hypothetical protein